MTGREAFERDLLEKALLSTERGPWLVILPASGTVRRMHGALLLADLGGEARGGPYIVDPRNRVALGVDPRALIVHDRTLAVAWQPRENLGRVHKAAGEWYARNPNVFRPETGSGFSQL